MRQETVAALRALEDGNPPAEDAGLFGASVPDNESALVIIPVPWEATVSYGAGTAQAPEAILRASHQLDLFDLAFGKPFMAGISMVGVSPELLSLGERSRAAAERVISGKGDITADLIAVNAASARVNALVQAEADKHLAASRLVAVVGGDHSSPLGLIKALANKHSEGFGILHFDAHFDLREAYEGFTYSHASIMYNALSECPQVSLVQVGIRDFSLAEASLARTSSRVQAHYARDLFRAKASGESFARTTARILKDLPPKVYVSFDIDGLDPSFCPGTGTPVPGGLSFDEAMYIIEELAASGRKIIGFDLCEVAPGEGEWDANVGARVLYKLCGAALHSQGLCSL